MSDNRIDTGGPAYPYTLAHIEQPHAAGMTLLDHFAGQALAGWSESHHRMNPFPDCDAPLHYADGMARVAYNIAAAMLAEKRRREGGDAHA